jgi:hypothetical protein
VQLDLVHAPALHVTGGQLASGVSSNLMPDEQVPGTMPEDESATTSVQLAGIPSTFKSRV